MTRQIIHILDLEGLEAVKGKFGYILMEVEFRIKRPNHPDRKSITDEDLFNQMMELRTLIEKL